MKKNIFSLTLASVFVAIIFIFTFIPNTGYIIVSGLAITTLHIPVIIGATLLSIIAYNKYGARFFPSYAVILGGVWGISCMMLAFYMPILTNQPFQNPLISVLPRLLVGLVAGYSCVFFRYKAIRIIMPILIELFIIGVAIACIVENKMGIFIFVLVGQSLLLVAFFMLKYFAGKQTEANKNKYLSYAYTAALATLSNTLFVIIALLLFDKSSVFGLNVTLKTIFLTAVTVNGLIELIIAIVFVPPITALLEKLYNKTVR